MVLASTRTATADSGRMRESVKLPAGAAFIFSRAEGSLGQVHHRLWYSRD
jgi:hypothetical protein